MPLVFRGTRVCGGHSGSPVPDATCRVSWVQGAAAGCVWLRDPLFPDCYLALTPNPGEQSASWDLVRQLVASRLVQGCLLRLPALWVWVLSPCSRGSPHPCPCFTLCLSPPSTPRLYTPASPWVGRTLTRGEQGWAGVSCPPPPPLPCGAQLDLGTAEWDPVGRVAGQAWPLGFLGPRASSS